MRCTRRNRAKRARIDKYASGETITFAMQAIVQGRSKSPCEGQSR
jgi:hypothetical protein